MRTVIGQNRGAMGLKVIGVAVTALVIGAWILPSGAQMEGVPVGPVHTPAEIAPDANADSDLSVEISFPATLQDGQYCVAYAVAWGGATGAEGDSIPGLVRWGQTKSPVPTSPAMAP